jgi:DnaJ-domain-containing protein 1
MAIEWASLLISEPSSFHDENQTEPNRPNQHSHNIPVVAVQGQCIPFMDPYSLLGIDLEASDKQITTAYRKLSIKLHPDKVLQLFLVKFELIFAESR